VALIITTGGRPDEVLETRGRAVAEACGVPYVARRGRSMARLKRDHEAELVYVVGHDKERLDDGIRSLFVHEGLLRARLAGGMAQPLIRAVTDGQPARRIVDGTLGLAIDALHLAAATGAEVLGIEAVPAIHALSVSGLPRLAAGGLEAAGRVEPVLGLNHERLATLPTDHADAVFLAPMFDAPAAAAPGWDLLRPLACYDPVDETVVGEALRVAPRLAVKLAPSDRVPPAIEARSPSWVHGRSVRYAVVTRG
jgi:hypothetical protein